MMAFCESQWFGGGGATSTPSSASDAIWYGNGSTYTHSSYTGINCWMTTGSGGSGKCTTTEYYNQHMQVQTALAAHQQMIMQVQTEMSEEQRQQRQAQAEALQQAQLEQLKLQTEAGAKAKELLLEHLTPTQKETFNKNKWFVVEGGKSKQQYRIQADHCSINIEVMEGKKVKHKLCAHLHHSAGAPLHDHILAQKIMLEAAEDDFLKIANRHAA